LGNVLQTLVDYAAARGYYKKTIAIFTRHYGANHSQTKIVKGNLAVLEEAVASKSPQKQPKGASNDDKKDNDAQESNCILM